MNTVLVYQMGKVGSTSIHKSLLDCGYKENIDCFHIHDLVKPTMIREQTILTKLNHIKPDIITLTREPVARNISSFFQSMDLESRKGQWYIGSKETIAKMTINELIAAFLNCPAWKHEEPLHWFDKQLKNFFNIDVYNSNFDTNQGWQTYHNNLARCLLIRLENLDNLDNIVNDFLNIRIKKRSINRAEDHWYVYLYRKFLDSIVVPTSYLDKMYGSRYAKFFYSEKEVVSFRKRWGR